MSKIRGLTLTLAVGLALTVLPAGGSSSTDVRATAAAANPLLAQGGGVDNATFYYDGRTPLTEGSDLSKLGHPALVVTTPKSDEPATVRAIHATGAQAYRYIQFYWAPSDQDYGGINLATHPGWAFCGNGKHRVLGRLTNHGKRKWFFIDANEKAVRARFKTILGGLKADGWDGVMFDRGEAGTQSAVDAHGVRHWYRRSTCTNHAYKPRATFSDAFVNMLGLAHSVGLRSIMNNGKSPFDPVAPMRPRPSSAACRQHRPSCHALSDVWSKVDLVLNEAATKPRDVDWRRLFIGNQRSERSAAHGRRTLALITTGSLGGAKNQTRAKVFYAWSRIKLFDLSVAVNTGDGGCGTGGSTSGVCNRYGVHTDLVDTRFGRPLGSRPVRQNCASGSRIHCVWVRRYAHGLNVVNVRPSPRNNVRLTLRTSGCRYVYDVYHRVPLAHNRCVLSLRMNLPRWSGRPLTYSRTPR